MTYVGIRNNAQLTAGSDDSYNGTMSTQVLATKLYIPPLRSKVVLRPRLVERLNEGLSQHQGFGRKLTLISAPAGFGKTTLVSEWVAGCECPVAWLSLDEGDNDLNRFLTYLVAALQTIAARRSSDGTSGETIGEEVLALLQSPPPVPTEPILTTLLNEISTISDSFILVLDDYHEIDAKAVDYALTFLIERMPPQMHLVIATREDPPLPLARLRVRGQLIELRAAELRFTPDEAGGFLNQAMDLTLSAEEVIALETRTEGWIAGLQLAALALQGTLARQRQNDAASFIQSFTGSHRFVLDYLAEEVLEQQPERVQAFLLHTSILDRMCGPLCDAVLNDPSTSGQEILEYLDRANLLVVPLDDKRQWYRYHHLFADVLQARLQKEQPKHIPGLHRCAGEWFEQNELPSEAIRHALAAKDYERAADLIELAWSEVRRSCFQSPTWLGWVKALPDEMVRPRPVLNVGYAWELLNFGEMEAAEVRMQDAKRLLEPASDLAKPVEMVVVNEEEFVSLPGSLATARAYHAQALGDVPGTLKHAQRAMTLVSESDYFTHGIASSLLGLAHWSIGDLETAARGIMDAMTSLELAGNALFVLSTSFALADIRIAQGRLHEAINTYKRALKIATAQGEAVLQGTADLYLGLSELYHEQGDQERAREHLRKSEELSEKVALPHWPYRLRLVQARIQQSQGDLDSALDLLDDAERLQYNVPVPAVRPITALKARVWVVQGKLNEALEWVRERGLSVDDELSYLHEFEHVTLVRMLIAQYRRDRVDGSIRDAAILLDRLLKAAEAGERKASVIEILLLQALAHEAQGDIPAALVSLERALTLAEPEGYVRMFVDEGLSVANLLEEAEKQGIALNYVRQLLRAFGKADGRRPITQDLLEPLSDRELEVLRLLGTELNGPEIARELMVSLNTMRTHTKNIYSKLGVNNRRAAVRRAEELDLI